MDNRILNILLILFLLFNFLGCSKYKSEEESNTPSINQSLLTVDSTNENIIDKLEQFYFKNRKNKQVQKEDKQKEEEEKKESDDKKEKLKEQMDREEWKGLTNKVEQLFKNWNRYESERSLPETQVKSIEKKMNQLTAEIEEEEMLSALFKANQLNLDLAILYRRYYNKELRAVIKEMRAYMRSIVYWSKEEENNRFQGTKNLEKLEQGVNKMKNLVVKKEDKQLVKELENYIQDLNEVIEEQNNSVLEIKGNLVLNKLSQLK
ncbi:MAG: hypothetical protein R6V17_01035 [Halanaerobacter sp.]